MEKISDKINNLLGKIPIELKMGDIDEVGASKSSYTQNVPENMFSFFRKFYIY